MDQGGEIDKFLDERRKQRKLILERHGDGKPSAVVKSIPAKVVEPISPIKRKVPTTTIKDEPMVEFDMFSDNPISSAMPLVQQQIKKAVDNYDDHEGYYRIIVGEKLLQRFEILGTLGKGVFSNVVKALDHTLNKQVAIKITRNNDLMRNAAKKEIEILKLLDTKNTIKLLNNFDYRGHKLLVFEMMKMDLRQVLKKFGKNVGLNLKGVKSYCTQLFNALNTLKQQKVLHCDIKPDNILVSESMAMLKLADFGSAMYINEIDVTPYLISRFYRAPEIILGCLPFDYAIDVWSVGCTLYEIYTGKILFPGKTNNHMLKLMMEMGGPFPKHMLKRGSLTSTHFNDNLEFVSFDLDKISGKPSTKVLTSFEVKPIKQRLKGGDEEMFTDFVHFLNRCLSLAPEKRMTPQEAFRHPFLTSQYQVG